MNRYTAIFLSIFSCTSVIVIICQSMLSMLWHLKVDCDVQLLRTSIAKKLNCDSLKKVVPRSFRKPTNCSNLTLQ